MKKLRTKKIGLPMLLISLFSSGIMSLIALSGFLTNVSSYIKNPVFAGSPITAHSMRAPGLYNDHWRLIESWDNIKNQFGVRTIKGVENSLYLKTESLEGILIVGNLDLEYTSLNSCFAGQDKLSAIYFRDSFNTSNVTNFAYMFSGCRELNCVDLSNFDISKATNLNCMFAYCHRLTSLDLSSFEIGENCEASRLLRACFNLETLKTPSFIAEGVEIELANDMKILGGSNTYKSIGYALANRTLNKAPKSTSPDPVAAVDWASKPAGLYADDETLIADWDTVLSSYFEISNGNISAKQDITGNLVCGALPTGITSLQDMFYGTDGFGYGLKTIVFKSDFDTSNVEDMSFMFGYCLSLTSLNVSSFDTSNVNCMYRMFYGCSSLTSLDVSNFDTSNVIHMFWMFMDCTSLTSLDVSNFDTSNVASMHGMFCGCESLTSLDLSNFDTSNVTDMSGMFHSCVSLIDLDVGNFDTSNVETMEQMFLYCPSLTSLDVSNFDTSNVTHMFGMFAYCISLTSLDVSNFDTSNVEDMSWMFAYCTSLTSLDLSDFDTSNVIDMSYMFSKCTALEVLYLSEDFVTSSCGDFSLMFAGCENLDVLDLSSFSFDALEDMDVSEIISATIGMLGFNDSGALDLLEAIESDNLSEYQSADAEGKIQIMANILIDMWDYDTSGAWEYVTTAFNTRINTIYAPEEVDTDTIHISLPTITNGYVAEIAPNQPTSTPILVGNNAIIYEDGKEPLPIPVPSVVPTAGIRLDNNIFMLALSAGASIISIVGVCLLLINKKRFMIR